MKKGLLFGAAFAACLLIGTTAQAAGPFAVPQQDLPDYEAFDGGDWGMQAPAGWENGDEPNLPAVQQGTIESIRFEDQPTHNAGFLFIPPDPHAAVGPNHIVTIVNCTIQWYLKTGGAAQNIQPLGKQTAAVTNAFFNSLTPVNALFDPKIIYDQYNQRFLVVALEQVGNPTNTSRLMFAVSDDSDPNGTWYFGAINSELVLAGAENWFDYPGLACDASAFYVTGNYFNYPGTVGNGSRLWIFPKAPFYAGGALAPAAGAPFDAAALSGFPNSTMMPSQMFGTPPAGVGTYLCLYSGLSDGTNEYFQTIRVDNPLSGAPTFTGDQALIGNIDTATGTLPRGNQAGSTNTATRIDTGDRRCLAALWRNGHIYAVFHTNPPAPSTNNGENTSYWLKEAITTGAGTVVDGGHINDDVVGTDGWSNYPSIAVDKLGNMAITVGVGSTTTFASAAYTTRSAGDAPGFLNPLTVYANGQAFYRRTFSSSTAARNRWGDYSACVTDPDECIFWSFHEYAGTQGTPTTVGGVTEQGRWWTRAVSYYVDDNSNGNPDGCEPVAVVLAKFEAVRDGVNGVIRWSVAEENNHLGFNLYREVDGGARMILHDGLLSGKVDYEFIDTDAPEAGARYWLQEVDRAGKQQWIGSIELTPASARPAVVALNAARPNPFNQATTVSFTLGSARNVHLAVYDAQGRKVATLIDGTVDAGDHSATWNGVTDAGSSAASGFYFVKLQSGSVINVQKVVLSR